MLQPVITKDAADAKENPASERQFLASMMRKEGISEAAQVMGGRAKLAAALTNPFDEVSNIHKPKPYRLGRAGDAVDRMAGMRSEELGLQASDLVTPNLTAAQTAARDYVIKMGKATGHEHGAAVSGGQVISQFTSGHPARLDIPEFAVRNGVEIHHNHSLGDSLSRADLLVLLSRDDLASVFVHGHNGATYSAIKLNQLENPQHTVNDAVIQSGRLLAEAVDRRIVTMDATTTGIRFVVAALLLEKQGHIRYDFNSESVMRIANMIVEMK